MTDNVTGWEVCGLFLPSVTPLWKKPHELGFLISLPCTMRLWSLERWSLWMQEVSQQRCIWWGCQAPSHQPGTQRVAFFNAPLLESLNTSSLTVFIPCSVYPSLNDSYEQKTLLSCSLCIFSFPFVFPFFLPFFFKSNWEWSKHNQPISATSRGTVNPCRSQGSPAKFGAFQFSLFFCQGERM